MLACVERVGSDSFDLAFTHGGGHYSLGEDAFGALLAFVVGCIWF